MIRSIFLLSIAIAVSSQSTFAEDALYELRVYSPEAGKESVLEELIASTAVPLMAKHDLNLVGAFTPLIESDQRILMLVSHHDKASADTNWAEFEDDTDWTKSISDASTSGRITSTISRFFIMPTDYSPVLSAEKIGARVFELRTYITTDGHLPNLNARFRNHTVALFSKYGMTNIFYSVLEKDDKSTRKQVLDALSPIGASNAETDLSSLATGAALIYLLAHESLEASQASFDGFRKDPEWNEARKASETEASGSLTVKDGVKSLFLKPLDFSPLQ